MAQPLRKDESSARKKYTYGAAANDSVYHKQPKMRVVSVEKRSANDPIYKQRRKTTNRSDLKDREIKPDFKQASGVRKVQANTGRSLLNGSKEKVSKQEDLHKDIASGYKKEAYAGKGLGKAEDQERDRQKTPPPAPQNDQQVRNVQTKGSVTAGAHTERRKVLLRKSKKKKRRLARLRARAVNVWILSTGLFGYFSFQFPIGLLSIVMFMAAAALDSLVDAKIEVSEDSSNILKGVAWVLNGVKNAVVGAFKIVNEAANDLFGIGIDIFHPGSAYVVLFMLLFCFGIIMLLLMYVGYKSAFLNPLSGEGASKKQGMFLLALIGYSIPILNVLPWFIFWMRSVRKHPI